MADLARRWDLSVGEVFQPGGVTAWVAAVRSNSSGADLVLKVGWAHAEAAHEAHGLALWAGDGAVRLHDAIEVGRSSCLLLERCRPGTALAERPEPEQDPVIAGLLRRLWREPPPGHPFRPLQAMCDEWADAHERAVAAGGPVVDPGTSRAGIELFRSLPASATSQVLLCTDLHAGNVLAAEREPWLVIDPKPHVGDPTFDALQHLLNCPGRLTADPFGLVGRMASLLEVDHERLRLWLFARCVQQSPDWPWLGGVARRLAR